LHSPDPSRRYTLSLHDALPILLTYDTSRSPKNSSFALPSGSRNTTSRRRRPRLNPKLLSDGRFGGCSITSTRMNCDTSNLVTPPDRKSTRLNSSHVKISYAVFC